MEIKELIPMVEESLDMGVTLKKGNPNFFKPGPESLQQTENYMKMLKSLPQSHWDLFKKPANWEEIKAKGLTRQYVEEKYFDMTPEEILYETECKIKYIKGDEE